MPKVPPKKITPKSLNDYFEVMSKSVFQSGMSWQVVENKWPGIREAFRDFDVRAVAEFRESDIENLAEDTRVVRNRRKLKAVVTNARKIVELEKTHGSFKKYLRSHDSFDATLEAMRNDFAFMGPTGIYAFLYTVGEDVIPHDEFVKRYRK